jgi:hypothetical protein
MTSSQENQPSSDPLETLLIDAREIDRAEIAATLQDIVGIDSVSGAVVFRPSSRRLGAREKLLAYLLGRKVAHLLDKIEVEGAKPKIIIADTGIAAGTVHPTLKELRENKLVLQDSAGGYLVAQHQLRDVLAKIKNEGDSP